MLTRSPWFCWHCDVSLLIIAIGTCSTLCAGQHVVWPLFRDLKVALVHFVARHWLCKPFKTWNRIQPASGIELQLPSGYSRSNELTAVGPRNPSRMVKMLPSGLASRRTSSWRWDGRASERSEHCSVTM
uniref:(northern house mosquito) hypothetical protein n=1 Tax=Culex pipiens TaxID=7175 RepID=A0A8D8C2P1_CULPI